MVCLLNMDKLTVREGVDLGFSRSSGGAGKISEKVIFGHFYPSKLSYIGAGGAFRKISGSVRHQIWISQNSAKGGPFGSAGGRIPERRTRTRTPPPPQNPPLGESVRKIWGMGCLQVIQSFFFV